MKKLVLGTSFICAVVLSCIWNSSKKEPLTDLDILSIQNVEALAAGEELGDYACWGRGEVDCPNGTKVKYYANNLSLD